MSTADRNLNGINISEMTSLLLELYIQNAILAQVKFMYRFNRLLKGKRVEYCLKRLLRCRSQ